MFEAAVLTELNKPLKITELNHLEPKINQVKVETITSGLCGAQVNEMSGKKGPDKYLPHLLGHEGFGKVVSVGEDVTKVKEGDHVILHWRESSGKLCEPIKYTDKQNQLYGAGPVTTFSNFTIVSENRCTKLSSYDPSLNLIYPLMGCALSTSYGAVFKEAKVKSTDKVIIFGAGGLGLSILFWLKTFKIDNLPIVIDIHDEKSKHVENLGGKFINAKSKHKPEEADIIFETSGSPLSINNALNFSRNFAQIVLIGQTGKNQNVSFDDFSKVYNGINIYPSMGGHFEPDTDLEIINKEVLENKDLANFLISHKISLSEINHGFDLMKSPEAKRIIIEF